MEPSGEAYDATQIDLCFTGMPNHEWHPAALLKVLVDCSNTSTFLTMRRFPSSLQRHIATTSAAARLSELHFDVDELMRSVFRPAYVGAAIRLLTRGAYDLSNDNPFPDPLIEYAAMVVDEVGSPESGVSYSGYLRSLESGQAIRLMGRRVAGWMQEATLRDILGWKLPSVEDWPSLPQCDTSAVGSESQWLADRFLLTYPADWHTQSLHTEYRWARGEIQSPVPDSIIRLRSIANDRLNALIAERAVIGDPSKLGAVQSSAVDALLTGQFEQAVALFQGAMLVSPSDWARNGMAFSLIPTDPDAAAEMFGDLLGSYDDALVFANMAAIARIQGSMERAHDYAKKGLVSLEKERNQKCFLWGFEDDQPVLMTDFSLRDYLRVVLSW